MYNNWDMGARVGYCVDNARPFFGYMDEFAIWRRALTQEEIQEHMEEGIKYAPGEVSFKRGDANSDGEVNIADAIAILAFLFAGGKAPKCPDAADTNDDGSLNIADAVGTLSYLFAGTTMPDPGALNCGFDPTEDNLQDCEYPAELCAP